MTKQLTLRTRTTPAGALIELAGELDYHTAGKVRTMLPTVPLRAGQQLTLDLGGLTFCDSSGITMLILVRNHAQAAGALIALAAIPDYISRILRVVGLEHTFLTHPTAEAAEAAWHSTGS